MGKYRQCFKGSPYKDYKRGEPIPKPTTQPGAVPPSGTEQSLIPRGNRNYEGQKNGKIITDQIKRLGDKERLRKLEEKLITRASLARGQGGVSG